MPRPSSSRRLPTREGKSSPLSFLKPWIEKEIFGKGKTETQAPAAGEPTGALPDTAPADAPPSAGADQPPLGANGGSALRGGADAGDTTPDASMPDANMPDANAPDESAPLPDAPPPDVATDEPGPDSVPPVVEEAKPEPLRFAALAGRSAAAEMALIGPIADDLGRLLDRPVEFLPFPTYGAMIDAQVERRIDGGFFSAAAFALAESRCGCLQPLVAPRAFDGTLSYHAIIVTRANSAIHSTADLAGKTVAMGAVDSIGARRMQLAGLMAEGFDPATFGSVVETDSAEAAVRLVADGRADAAFAWSSLAGRIEDGYSRGTLTQLVADGAVPMQDLAILWRSPAIEHGPFALMRALDEPTKSKIEAYFVALITANPTAYDGLNPYYGGGYAPVDQNDYSGLDVLTAQNVDALRMPKVALTPAAAPADAQSTAQ